MSNATDEQILAYESQVKDLEARKSELVSVPLLLDVLLDEYRGGASVFSEKIQNLNAQHSHFRRCRGDGNYYLLSELNGSYHSHRVAGQAIAFIVVAFAFAWYERILRDPVTTAPRALAQLQDSKSLLLRNGFQLLSFEDFLDVTVDTVTAIQQGLIHDEDMLLSRFQVDEISNSIVVMMRFITSAWLQDPQNRDEFEPFVMEWGGITTFCTQQVEAVGRESEEIQIMAATRALKTAAEVAYLDGNMNSSQVNFHRYIPEDALNPSDPILLLYRPGHYDLLYKKNEM